ncbi:hypothetical protein Nwi_0313 [Nitrobacter winogradskyi Nb-255]|uniref:Uncharacterized protein n=1 Tax=Nitrobacter winogradskyi (strain ATCC 25391 / DSM 10237 / CIP 104748 / NCIMB 11846 / Nb-255) TaxID=323098 RepID=Q3SVW1_NITWN|nr:hypothetical protein Nwi_0313 [Nitrobacter winogradskyi Nb-255]
MSGRIFLRRTGIHFAGKRSRGGTHFENALDHDDSGSKRSRRINAIDFDILRSGRRAENRHVLARSGRSSLTLASVGQQSP